MAGSRRKETSRIGYLNYSGLSGEGVDNTTTNDICDQGSIGAIKIDWYGSPAIDLDLLKSIGMGVY